MSATEKPNTTIRNRPRAIRASFLVFLSLGAAALWITGKYALRSPLAYVVKRFLPNHLEKYTNSAIFPTGTKVNPVDSDSPSRKAFNWTDLEPSAALRWAKCYGHFECARFRVPLDHAVPYGEDVAVALIRLPSKPATGRRNYKGPLLINPGGPGGSGVDFILKHGAELHTIIGDEYDLVSFDPRGVGFTTPGLDIFGNVFDHFAHFLREPPLLNSTPDALGVHYAKSQAIGLLVEERSRKVAEHVSTPAVARDMLGIVNAYGESALQYWGFSYGSVLGATFAAMFPDKINRMIIDGVVDSENYYKTLWSNNLRDTDALLAAVYEACVKGGPAKCPLYENNATLVAARVDKIIEALALRPLPVFNPDGKLDIVDKAFVVNAIFRTLYTPHATGMNLTHALVALERGNPKPIWEFSGMRGALEEYACDCSGRSSLLFMQHGEANRAIACSDGEEVRDSFEELQEFYDELAVTSGFAKLWTQRAGCSGWRVPGKERFSGTFEVNTSFPLLLIGTTLDPVTPLWSAHKMANQFNGSIVISQDSHGHCSITAASLCTARNIRAYLHNGSLPQDGTICETQTSIFDEGLSIDLDRLDHVEKGVLLASYKLAKSGVWN